MNDDIKAIRQVIADRIHKRAMETCQGEPIWPEIRAIVDEIARQELRMRAMARAAAPSLQSRDDGYSPWQSDERSVAVLRAIGDGSELP